MFRVLIKEHTSSIHNTTAAHLCSAHANQLTVKQDVALTGRNVLARHAVSATQI